MTITPSSSIADAQREMRAAYYGGAPGMLTSALTWLVAGLVCVRLTPQHAVWTLFVGGMLIHPISVLFTRALGRSGKHSPGNPLGTLALATTIWLVLSCALAYAIAIDHSEWFFPAMLFVIGGRYMTFATMFGTRLYWVCGFVLVLGGYVLGRAGAAPQLGAFTGALIEAAFAAALFVTSRREPDA